MRGWFGLSLFVVPCFVRCVLPEASLGEAGSAAASGGVPSSAGARPGGRAGQAGGGGRSTGGAQSGTGGTTASGAATMEAGSAGDADAGMAGTSHVGGSSSGGAAGEPGIGGSGGRAGSASLGGTGAGGRGGAAGRGGAGGATGRGGMAGVSGQGGDGAVIQCGPAPCRLSDGLECCFTVNDTTYSCQVSMGSSCTTAVVGSTLVHKNEIGCNGGRDCVTGEICCYEEFYYTAQNLCVLPSECVTHQVPGEGYERIRRQACHLADPLGSECLAGACQAVPGAKLPAHIGVCVADAGAPSE